MKQYLIWVLCVSLVSVAMGKAPLTEAGLYGSSKDAKKQSRGRLSSTD